MMAPPAPTTGGCEYLFKYLSPASHLFATVLGLACYRGIISGKCSGTGISPDGEKGLSRGILLRGEGDRCGAGEAETK